MISKETQRIVGNQLLNPADKIVWLFLRGLESGAEFSFDEIAASCVISKSTAQRACRILKTFEFVKLKGQRGQKNIVEW